MVLLTTPGDGSASISPSGAEASAALGIDAERLLAAERARGEAGEIVVVPLGRSDGPDRLFFAGIGDGGPAALRSAGAAIARRGASSGRVALDARELPAASVRALVEGLALAAYTQPRPERARSAGADTDSPTEADAPPKVLAEALLALARSQTAGDADAVGADVAAAVAAALTVARAVHLARDLVNTPSLVKSPDWLAERAAEAGAAAGLEVEILGPAELAAGGFGGILAVGQGSPRPPRLVRLTYQPAASPSGAGTGSPADDGASSAGDPDRPAAGASGDGTPPRHVVLVGKGITFDSGGLSLKPAVPMAAMKTDMAGAAAVLGTMTALGALGVRTKVTGLLCIAENMIDGGAMRPGDVLTAWGGTTVEVLNTDAEGRLVLADGLAYAAGTLAPDALVDLATLTGAISVALGRRTAGLFSSDDALAEALAAAAGTAGERVWRLPLTAEYRPALESTVADLANIGKAMNVQGGSITAALFLREFTGGVPWAHLDIAGSARSDSDDAEVSKGGTGWGVRTLLAWLAD